MPSGANRLKFPQGWDKQVMYATVDRPDTKQYREFYTSAEAVRAAREGKPLPNGTVITAGTSALRSDVMLKGQSATLKFDAAGNIVDYVCGLHPGMKGKIKVGAKM